MTKTQKTSSLQQKATYRVRNWSQYNKSLMQRGSITLWIDEEVIANWHPEALEIRARGGQMQYSDQAIECVLMIKAVYRLPYRQSVGFTQSLMDLMGAEVRVPDYSTVCKRSADLAVDPGVTGDDKPKHIAIDSSDLSVNTDTHELEAVVLSEASVDDAEAGKTLLTETAGDIDQVDADGAYDKRKFYEAASRRGIKCIIIPPRKDAKIWQYGNSKAAPLPRDDNLRHIQRTGRKKWKRDTN